MTASPNDPIHELKAVLAEHLPWHGARISFLAQFLLALLKVRSVSLAELATGFGGKAKVDSHYKRLQRFFRSFGIGYDDLARLLVRIGPVGDGPWRLTMDRTNGQFGKADINFLVLGIACHGIALPVFWSVLDKAGNSDTAERVALMGRFLKVFGVATIEALLADREFVGEDWFRWLQSQGIPFHQRLKRNTLAPNGRNRMMRLDVLFGSLKPGDCRHLPAPAGAQAGLGRFRSYHRAAPGRRRLPVHRLILRATGRSHRRLRRPLAGRDPVRLPEEPGLQLRGYPPDRPRAPCRADGPARSGLRLDLPHRPVAP